VRWDPRQYGRYADERSRPFWELVARVHADEPGRVVDLGCGPGELTAALTERWTTASVVGVDSSPDMVAAAASYGGPRVRFEQGDVETWRPDGGVDVVIANAVFHWVPGHVDLLPRFAAWLTDGGWLAFQVPDNFAEPSHTLLRSLCSSTTWRQHVGDAAEAASVERPERYFQALHAAGFAGDVWQTTYLHVLRGDDPVLEWVKGTTLRPVLTRLTDDAERARFLDEYAALLREAYPQMDGITVFPFRRTFAVGQLTRR